MYDHDSLTCPPAPYPPQLYPETGQPNPWANEALMKQKSDFYWACKSSNNVVLDRCDECLKNADEKCQEIDPAQKNQCIINQCGNFSDISNNIVTPLPTDPDSAALEFYNRCVKEEAKDACFTCLKEYFMPATYCDQAQDYMARSIIKYPALVKKVRSGLFVPDHEIWLGPYDKIMGEQGGGECDNNDEAESIDLALICRIMPDFKYKGEKVCETRCSQSGLTGQTLTDALKDITDFRPNGKDCNGLKLPIGGKETWVPVNDGVFYTRGKCCGALWQHDTKKYTACVGGGTETAVVPPPPNFCICGWDHPECCCAENWRPVALGRDGWVRPDTAPYGGDCFNAGFSSDGAHQFFMHMNNGSTTSDVPFIATSDCSETDENLNNTDQLPTLEENLANGNDFIGDDLPDSPPNDTDATPPSGVVWDKTDVVPGEATQYCIPNVPSGNYTVGIYHNDNQDIVSGIQLCQKCDSSDNGYPFYGTSLDQCTGKEGPLEVPAGCE
jgi:hypothetical protein